MKHNDVVVTDKMVRKGQDILNVLISASIYKSMPSHAKKPKVKKKYKQLVDAYINDEMSSTEIAYRVMRVLEDESS